MKFIYTLITILLLGFNANAATYYIDINGNDANNGTTIKTAWQTIAKINGSRFLPGDHILFKTGGVWNERLDPPSSGSVGKPIIFSSYGRGAKPIITGLQTVTGFTNLGNIWSSTATNSATNLNTVLINGVIKAKARYPNTGYLTFKGYEGKSQITGSITGSPDYTGAEVVVRSTHWMVDVSKIVSQVGGTLNFSPELSYIPKFGGNGYFIQNSPLALDAPGEWAFDEHSKKLQVYANQYPKVQISTIDTLVYIASKQFIILDGLSIQGANAAAIQLRSTNHITIQNCTINFSGRWAIAGVLSSYVSIVNNAIQNSLSNAIYFVTSDFTKPGCDYVVIDNNKIKNSGVLVGMALVQYTRYCGIFISGIHPTITNNRIDSTGYNPIMFYGSKALVKNNYISNFCFVKDDGGGIYTGIGTYYPTNYNDGSIIRSNIIINGIGAPAGTLVSGNSPAPGIYLDDDSRLITVDSNTVSNCSSAAIYFNRVNSITFRENTMFNMNGDGLAIFGTNEFGNNMNIKRNIIISLRPQHVNILRVSGTSMSNIDSNYYSKVSDKNTRENFKISGTLRNLSNWNKTTGQDTHSISIPLDIVSSPPLFYYNPNKKDSTFKLMGTYYDAKGRVYKNSIKLHAFTSAVLYKTPVSKNID